MEKRKLKKRLIIFLFILLILGIGGVTIYFTKDLFWPDNKPTQTGTEKTATEILEEQGIKLVNKETFVKEANTLLDKGYSSEEINQIYEHMSENNLKEILKSPYQNLENRMKFQKHKLNNLLENYDETLSERENMKNNGYLWIYDCGNIKMKFSKK